MAKTPVSAPSEPAKAGTPNGEPAKAGVPSAHPSIGRIVHYVLPTGPSAGRHRPGMIVNVDVETETATLMVFSDSGPHSNDGDWLPQVFRVRDAAYGERKKAGTWHWPERD